MKRFAAHYIFPGKGKPLRNSTLTISDDGTITDISEATLHFQEKENTEFHNGIIVPGFVNAACNTGLSSGTFQEAKSFLHDIYHSGFSAICDFIHSDNHFDVKVQRPVSFHHIIEIENPTQDTGSRLKSLYSRSVASGIPVTFCLNTEGQHFAWLHSFSPGHIHNRIMIKNFSPESPLLPSQITANIPKQFQVLCLNCCFSDETDIESLQKHFSELFWIISPSFLESKNLLSHVKKLIKKNAPITISHENIKLQTPLHALEELNILQSHYPSLPLEELIGWATINGAKALQCQDQMGSIEVGKRPGLNLITNMDFRHMKITKTSRLIRLV